MISKLKNFLKDSYYLDLRSLALVRVIFGSALFVELCYRYSNLVAHYSDIGILPRDVLIKEVAHPWNFSFYLITGEPLLLKIIFFLNFICIFFFIIGYKTRVFTILTWLFLISLHNRNWYILNSGDDAARVSLFLFMFLPMGARYSIDSALSLKNKLTDKFRSPWVIIMAIQIGFVYFVSFFHKQHPVWLSEYSAIYYALELDIFVTHFGLWFRQFESAGKVLTFFIIWLELLGPVFLWLAFFIGRKFHWIKTLVVLSFIGFHAGLILTMEIGAFPWFMMILWTLFLPSEFWSFVNKYIKTEERKTLALYYDEDCGFCKKMVLIIKTFILVDETQIRTCQSDSSILDTMEKENSWVVVNHSGERFTRFEGIIEVAKHIPLFHFLWRILNIKFIKQIGNSAYVWVSNNRNKVSFLTKNLELRSEFKFRESFYLSLTLSFIYLLTITQWNLENLKVKGVYKRVDTKSLAQYLNIYQTWSMFSPWPLDTNVRFYINGMLNDKTPVKVHINDDKEIDLIKQIEFKNEEELYSMEFKDKFWRKYFLNLVDDTKLARFYTEYLCRKYTRKCVLDNTFVCPKSFVINKEYSVSNFKKRKDKKEFKLEHFYEKSCKY
jgi:predicted DCC family thiol-disulfide oxidoreductase YuxK